jgi:hypothetical protein
MNETQDNTATQESAESAVETRPDGSVFVGGVQVSWPAPRTIAEHQAAIARGEADLARRREENARRGRLLDRLERSAGARQQSVSDPLLSLAGHTGNIGLATQRFWTERQSLYRGDGTPIFSQPVHDERLRAARNSFDNTVGAALSAADAITTAAEVTVQALTEGDLLDQLGPAERAAARDKAMFIQEDVAKLHPRELVARMRSVLADGDRSSAYLWSRYGSQRLLGIMREAAATGRAPATPVAERAEMEALLTKLRGVVLGAQGQERLTEAKEAIGKAKALRRVALGQSADVHDVFGEVKERLRATNPAYRA